MIDKSNIAILTTVANFELYQKTSQLFPAKIQKYVIDGTDGMYGIESIYFMMKKLRGTGVEWLIMADEDVVFKNSDTIFDIILAMKKNEITVCGIRDGGVIKHRKQNPYVINTFFSILNFKEIESIWNKKEVKKNQYVLENEFNDDLSNLKGEFDLKSLYEPYYCFYLWLRRKGKRFLFLDATMHDDGITNNVLYKDKVFLSHTWYARSYNVNQKHTKRINEVLREVTINFEQKNLKDKNSILFKDTTFVLKKKLNKIIKRLVK